MQTAAWGLRLSLRKRNLVLMLSVLLSVGLLLYVLLGAGLGSLPAGLDKLELFLKQVHLVHCYKVAHHLNLLRVGGILDLERVTLSVSSLKTLLT